MQAKKNNDLLEFRQGGDPYKKLQLGKYFNIKIRDRFKTNINIWFNSSTDELTIKKTNQKLPIISVDEKFTIYSENDNSYRIAFGDSINLNDYIDINKSFFNELLYNDNIKKISYANDIK